MHKLFIFYILLFLTSTTSFSQWNSNFDSGTETYVFADTAAVKSAPSLQSTVIDTLSAGDIILIQKSMAEKDVLNGFEANWVQISYTKNNVQQEGYIWSGFLAFSPLRTGEIKFVYGAAKVFKKDSTEIFDLEIKVYRGEKRVGTLQFPLDYEPESFSFIGANLYGNKGLKNIEKIIEVNIGGQSCGIANRLYYFGFRNNEIVPIYNITSVGDDDYHSEELIFPTDKGGKPNVVFLKIEDGEDTGNYDKKGNFIYKKKKQIKQLKWNGNVLSEKKK